MSTTSASSPSPFEARVLANAHCGCGENPFYASGRVLWTDIPNGRLFALDLKSGKWGRIYEGPQVGGFTLQSDGSLLLFRDRNIARLDSKGDVQVLVERQDLHTGRFNDVIAGPEGRVYAGTMGRDGQPNGGLFRVERDGRIEQLWDGTHCSNGMAFSGDLRGFFWTDSSAQTIFAFDFDRDKGEMTNRRAFWESNGRGVPDGLTIDLEGNLWVAFYDRACLRVLDSQGQIQREIPLPTRNITSCVFGGLEMSTLFITSAEGKDEDGKENLAGAVFAMETQAVGRAEFTSRVMID